MDRRDFLKATLSGSALFAFSGFTSILPRRALAATISATFIAEQVDKTLVDGVVIPVWQLRSADGGPGALGAGLVAQSGDAVSITLQNNLDRAVNLVVPGLFDNSPACAPGASRAYSFTATTAGAFLIVDKLNGGLSRAMGLAAPLIVHDGGVATAGGYTLVLQDLDDQLNRAIAAGQTYDLANYAPNYFFINGLSSPQTETDPDTAINMTVGQDVGLRFLNAGLIYAPMHFHGYHVTVMSRNRQPEAAVIDKDTVLVKPDECVDLSLHVTQPGVYPLHSHYVPAVTANGVYSNGAMLMMTAV